LYFSDILVFYCNRAPYTLPDNCFHINAAFLVPNRIDIRYLGINCGSKRIFFRTIVYAYQFRLSSNCIN